jgi:hypothetical protein
MVWHDEPERQAWSLEHEYPPRFAQALGGIFVALGTAAYLLGPAILGWAFARIFGTNDRLLKLPVGPLRQV